MDFKIYDVEYTYAHINPKPMAKYGLGLTYWYSNINELLFFLEYIDRSWYNKEFIEISVCSYARIPDDKLEQVKRLCSFIVYAETDKGKEDGTMAHMNGAMYPFFEYDPFEHRTIVTATHVDADEIILNAAYFFGLANMLLDSEKTILNTQHTYLYDMEGMKDYEITYAGDWTSKLNHFMIFNVDKARRYYPVAMHGDFHKDLWGHFVDTGHTRDDILLIKRSVFCNDVRHNFLHGFNFHLGMVHAANVCEWPETEDRKIRLLRLFSVDAWDDMPTGFRWHVNPESPVPYYKRAAKPPREGYEPHLYTERD